MDTRITEGKGDICAAWIVFFWIYILCLGFRSEAGQGWVDAIPLGGERELREEVGKDDQRRDKKEGQSETVILAGWGHTEQMRAKHSCSLSVLGENSRYRMGRAFNAWSGTIESYTLPK